MSNENTNEWAAREIGALWKKEELNQKYLSGKLKLPDNLGDKKDLGVVVFTNRHKNQENHPDFRVYLDSKSVVTTEGQAEQPVEQPADQATEEIL